MWGLRRTWGSKPPAGSTHTTGYLCGCSCLFAPISWPAELETCCKAIHVHFLVHSHPQQHIISHTSCARYLLYMDCVRTSSTSSGRFPLFVKAQPAPTASGSLDEGRLRHP